MENDFSDVKADDKVFHVIHRYGTVVEVLDNSFKAIFTDQNNTLLTLWFFFDGRCNRSEKNPSVFWDEVKITPPPKPKRKVEKIIELWLNFYKNNDIDAKTPVRFYHYPTKEKADEMCDKFSRLGDACHIIHKYTVEE